MKSEVMKFEIELEGFFPGITPRYTRRWKDAIEVRLHNKRVVVMPFVSEDGIEGYHFIVRWIWDKMEPITMTEKGHPFSCRQIRGKCWEQSIVFRKETALAIGFAMSSYGSEGQAWTFAHPGKSEEE